LLINDDRGHRPTFDPARGKEAPKGPAYHQRLLPAHTKLKVRQPGQGGEADSEVRDLRAELLKAEAAHYAKINGGKGAQLEGPGRGPTSPSGGTKRAIEDGGIGGGEDGEEENAEAKRRRVLEETRDIDADSDGGSASESSDEESDDEEDETAELLRELEKIKKERAEAREREVINSLVQSLNCHLTFSTPQETEKAAQEQEKNEYDVARGNPLLNRGSGDFQVKRRWDDDVIFKNQARGTSDKNKRKEFVNDLLRSDFHKRFMVSHFNPTYRFG
jgi:protein CWC15